MSPARMAARERTAGRPRRDVSRPPDRLASIAIAAIDHTSVSRLCAFVLAAGLGYAAWSYESTLNVRRPAVLDVRAARASQAQHTELQARSAPASTVHCPRLPP